jgi:hypothetical protein
MLKPTAAKPSSIMARLAGSGTPEFSGMTTRKGGGGAGALQVVSEIDQLGVGLSVLSTKHWP